MAFDPLSSQVQKQMREHIDQVKKITDDLGKILVIGEDNIPKGRREEITKAIDAATRAINQIKLHYKEMTTPSSFYERIKASYLENLESMMQALDHLRYGRISPLIPVTEKDQKDLFVRVEALPSSLDLLQAAREIPGHLERLNTLRSLFNHYMALEEFDKAEEVIDGTSYFPLLDTRENRETGESKDYMISALIGAYIKSGKLDKAESCCEQVTDLHRKGRELAVIANAYLKKNDLSKASKVAEKIHDKRIKESLLNLIRSSKLQEIRAIIEAYLKEGKLAEAGKAAHELPLSILNMMFTECVRNEDFRAARILADVLPQFEVNNERIYSFPKAAAFQTLIEAQSDKPDEVKSLMAAKPNFHAARVMQGYLQRNKGKDLDAVRSMMNSLPEKERTSELVEVIKTLASRETFNAAITALQGIISRKQLNELLDQAAEGENGELAKTIRSKIR